ncbi:MAG: helix-turn-helix domain-containing protein [Catenulispora sp.]|nr:helix-turn-helix domain-containing protein [Catenulispora sp.]
MQGAAGHDGDPVQELAAELRRLKEASGLSFSKLQAKIPFSRSALQRYLSGALAPPRDAVMAIGEVCGGDLELLTAMRDRVDAALAAGQSAAAVTEVVTEAGAGQIASVPHGELTQSDPEPPSPASVEPPDSADRPPVGSQTRLRIRALRAWGGLAVVIGLIFLLQHAMDGEHGGSSTPRSIIQGPDVNGDATNPEDSFDPTQSATSPEVTGTSGATGPVSPAASSGRGGIPSQPYRTPPGAPGSTPPPSSGKPSGPATSPSGTPPPAPGIPASFPDASTTGVPKGTQLTQSGPLVVTADNTTIQNLEVHGSITVDANNVHIKNVRVLPGSGDYWGIDQKESHTGLTVEHTEVRGDGKDTLSDAINNDGKMITIEAVDLSRMDKGVETASGVIADSYIHDPGPSREGSSNSIQAGPIAAHLTIRHNTLLNSLPATSDIQMGNHNSPDPVHDVTVEGNYLAGGAYSLYGGVTDAYPHGSYNIVIQDNVFSRRYFPHGGFYAPDAAFDSSGKGNVWRSNVWEGNQGTVLPD